MASVVELAFLSMKTSSSKFWIVIPIHLLKTLLLLLTLLLDLINLLGHVLKHSEFIHFFNLFEYLSSVSSTFFICGDLNIHADTPSSDIVKFSELSGIVQYHSVCSHTNHGAQLA